MKHFHLRSALYHTQWTWMPRGPRRHVVSQWVLRPARADRLLPYV